LPRVIVVAGPSGSGKSRLCARLGLPTVNLDDFYKDGSDPTLPRLETGAVDWDDPASWLKQQAVAAVHHLCLTRSADLRSTSSRRTGARATGVWISVRHRTFSRRGSLRTRSSLPAEHTAASLTRCASGTARS